MHISEQSKVRAGIKALATVMVVAAMAIPLVAYAATTQGQEPLRQESTEFVGSASDAPLGAAEKAEIEAARLEAERVEEERRLAEEAAAQAALEEETPHEEYQEPTYDADYSGYGNGSGLTMSGGVNYYDGRRETWYSSNVLHHYRTDEWTVDDEGFYRDSDGRYVVAASDKAQGETYEGSKGECIVLDSGCAAGTTDYYVAW